MKVAIIGLVFVIGLGSAYNDEFFRGMVVSLLMLIYYEI